MHETSYMSSASPRRAITATEQRRKCEILSTRKKEMYDGDDDCDEDDEDDAMTRGIDVRFRSRNVWKSTITK